MVRRLEILSTISGKWYGDYKRVRDIYISAATRIKGSIQIKELETSKKRPEQNLQCGSQTCFPIIAKTNVNLLLETVAARILWPRQ